MILGILSDTHGDAAITAVAVRMLLAGGAERLVHCGDVCGEAVLDAMAIAPTTFVFGNNDYDSEDLERYGKILGFDCLQFGGQLIVGDKQIAVTHGDSSRAVAGFLAPGSRTDYLLTGHSHIRHDQRIGRTRWINPGALYRAKVKSAALLDLATDSLTFLDIPSA